jgi:hypothetical protein
MRRGACGITRARTFFSFARPPAPPAPPAPLAPPAPPLPPDGHRPFGAAEARYLSAMAGAPPYAHARNPGVRVLPEIITPSEAAAALAVIDGEVLPRYGLAGEHASDEVRLAGEAGQQPPAHAALVLPRVNTARATGRAESARQTLAPWRYGDAFDAGALPPALRVVVDRVAAARGFALGSVRDVTVNAREGAFFKLDPHVDPAGDGETVFVVSLGPSPTVLTFSPPPRQGAARRAPADVSLKSWSADDLDALSLPCSAVAFSGAARWLWRHATRTGVLIDDPQPVVCDWWGSTDRLMPRRPGRRVSVVIAFGAQQGAPSSRDAALASAAAGVAALQ